MFLAVWVPPIEKLPDSFTLARGSVGRIARTNEILRSHVSGCSGSFEVMSAGVSALSDQLYLWPAGLTQEFSLRHVSDQRGPCLFNSSTDTWKRVACVCYQGTILWYLGVVGGAIGDAFCGRSSLFLAQVLSQGRAVPTWGTTYPIPFGKSRTMISFHGLWWKSAIYLFEENVT